MTDQELIQALRHCAAGNDYGCIGCPGESLCDECSGKSLLDAADRLETLLAENERLKSGKGTNVPTKWVSVEERLPEMHQSTYEDIDGTHKLYQSEPVLGVDISGDVVIVWHNRTDYGKSYWEDEPGNCYDITHWQPLPEPPSTEGVE